MYTIENRFPVSRGQFLARDTSEPPRSSQTSSEEMDFKGGPQERSQHRHARARSGCRLGANNGRVGRPKGRRSVKTKQELKRGCQTGGLETSNNSPKSKSDLKHKTEAQCQTLRPSITCLCPNQNPMFDARKFDFFPIEKGSKPWAPNFGDLTTTPLCNQGSGYPELQTSKTFSVARNQPWVSPSETEHGTTPQRPGSPSSTPNSEINGSLSHPQASKFDLRLVSGQPHQKQIRLKPTPKGPASFPSAYRQNLSVGK